jgi:hypothetical protein
MRNFLNGSAFKNFMKQIVARATIAIIAFALGVGSTAIWIFKRPSIISTPASSIGCVPAYDKSLVVKRIEGDDDVALFDAFEDLLGFST